MSVTTTNTSNTYTGDGVTQNFAFTFQLLTDLNSLAVVSPTDIQVYIAASSSASQVLQSSSTYTVNGPYASPANTVIFTVAPAAGSIILIQRNKPYTQTSRFLDGAAMPASSFELALDKVTMLVQQIFSLFTTLGFQGVLLTNAAPGSGTYTQGQWFLSPNPVAGGNWGWVCTTAGSPGTWEPFGPISLA